ncbi:hypothetical protein AB431_26050 [Mycobacterium sp. EPa45]|nr:hypothetical protein AB431_26050 [Mycobacterium sp. EPa45]
MHQCCRVVIADVVADDRLPQLMPTVVEDVDPCVLQAELIDDENVDEQMHHRHQLDRSHGWRHETLSPDQILCGTWGAAFAVDPVDQRATDRGSPRGVADRAPA